MTSTDYEVVVAKAQKVPVRYYNLVPMPGLMTAEGEEMD